ncbi:hypothetical protein SUDANB145_03083 [Streptomyces sp. enrichment culture]|uniref:hypothetical protein n=1 Tax=Streptomyces sp. enrichment culture TaxID=1795815 RepID=UPI003F55829A
MEQHTTDEVYEKVVDVEGKLDAHHKSSVTTSHFNTKVKDLEEAIKKGPEKEDPQNWKDLVKEMSPVKEFIAATKGGDMISTFILTATAVAAGVGIIVGLAAAFKKLTLAWTGRERQAFAFGAPRPDSDRQRQYIGRLPDGQVRANGRPRRWGLRPEDAATANVTAGAAAQPVALPSEERITAATDAMRELNSQIGIYRDKVRGLATPRAMRQMASAAKKLESAAKNHQNVSGLAGSIGNLNREMRELAATAG